MARRSQEKLSRGNRRGMVVIAGVVAVLLVVFMVQSRQISVKNASYESQKEELTQKLQDEELRSGEIDKLKDYVNSTEFIEKMASLDWSMTMRLYLRPKNEDLRDTARQYPFSFA